MTIRAVLFDLDDTLCDDLAATERAYQVIAERAKRHLPGLSLDRFAHVSARLSYEIWGGIDLIKPPKLAQVRRDIWQKTLAECGHADHGDLAAIVDDLTDLHIAVRRTGVHLFPDALATLDRLRADGFRLAVVTNGVSETHAEKIIALGIRDHFDAVLLPDEVGFAKPDARVFRLACEKLGVAPTEAAMVGDNPFADVAGAKGAGLFAVWYNPRGLSFPSQTLRPDAEVTTLAEVVDVIQAAHAASR